MMLELQLSSTYILTSGSIFISIHIRWVIWIEIISTRMIQSSFTAIPCRGSYENISQVFELQFEVYLDMFLSYLKFRFLSFISQGFRLDSSLVSE